MSASVEARDNAFYLKGEKLIILSGAVHYFRVVPEYWQDRLQKLKFCGLNCVETYVPWNLHEEIKDDFKFEGILNLRQFIQTAQRLDLYVILRPGPYICSEWDFGGLPSWLLADPNMKIRSSYKPYLDAVEKYFNKLLPLVADLQHSRGGPIISFQLENEYGSYGADLLYMQFLKQLMLKNDIVELLCTSDNGTGLQGDKLTNVLMTMNFQEKEHGHLMFEYLRNVKQPNKPMMVMELWSGWFDHWGENHHITPVEIFEETMKWILDGCGSFNLYMFHGGTNFGFMNGANETMNATNELKEEYCSDVTSYDYNAPVSENGQLTEKYFVIKKVLKEKGLLKIDEITVCPASTSSCSYGKLKIGEYMNLLDALQYLQKIESDKLLMMEELPMNNGGGQGYGFILYRCLVEGTIEKIKFIGRVKDRAVVLLNGKEISTVDNKWENYSLNVNSDKNENVLDVLVENMGRVNYAMFADDTMNRQRKGLPGLLVNGKQVDRWSIYPIEFKEDFFERIKNSDAWHPYTDDTKFYGPCLYRTILHLKEGCVGEDGGCVDKQQQQQQDQPQQDQQQPQQDQQQPQQDHQQPQQDQQQPQDQLQQQQDRPQQDTPQDTFISTEGWTKGNVFINNFNLGRYWDIGPQKTLYIPAPLIRTGPNQIIFFELHRGSSDVTFSSENNLGIEEIHKTNMPLGARAQLFVLRNTLKMGSWVWSLMKPFIK